MEKQTLLDVTFQVWLLIADLHHKMVLVREHELKEYGITARQMHVLRLINSLGDKARISAISKATGRTLDVVSRQAKIMENDGLIKRINDKPKSRLLKLELTEKGQELLKISRYSDGMNEVSSVITEKELLQLQSVLNRLLNKMNEYDPKHRNERLF